MSIGFCSCPPTDSLPNRTRVIFLRHNTKICHIFKISCNCTYNKTQTPFCSSQDLLNMIHFLPAFLLYFLPLSLCLGHTCHSLVHGLLPHCISLCWPPSLHYPDFSPVVTSLSYSWTMTRHSLFLLLFYIIHRI
jgi:hypothetical protein